MQDMFSERNVIIDELVKETDIMRTSGCQFAHNKRDYRKAVRVETLKHLMEGFKVTVISDLVRGLEYVADLQDARDCSEALYKSSQEKINVLKLRLRIIEDDINREWHARGD